MATGCRVEEEDVQGLRQHMGRPPASVSLLDWPCLSLLTPLPTPRAVKASCAASGRCNEPGDPRGCGEAVRESDLASKQSLQLCHFSKG